MRAKQQIVQITSSFSAVRSSGASVMNAGLKGGCVLLSVGVNIKLNECPVTLLLYYFITPFENMPFAVNCEICQSGSCVDFGKILTQNVLILTA